MPVELTSSQNSLWHQTIGACESVLCSSSSIIGYYRSLGTPTFIKHFFCSLVLIFGGKFFQSLQTCLSSSIRTSLLRHSSIRKPLILNLGIDVS